jgi:hypothetical protein
MAEAALARLVDHLIETSFERASQSNVTSRPS